MAWEAGAALGLSGRVGHEYLPSKCQFSTPNGARRIAFMREMHVWKVVVRRAHNPPGKRTVTVPLGAREAMLASAPLTFKETT
jgi:hypothetical protein